MSTQEIADKAKQLQTAYRDSGIKTELDKFWLEEEISFIPFTCRRRDIPVGLDHNEYELGFFESEELLSFQLDDRLKKSTLGDYYVPSLITGNSPYYLSIALGAKWKRFGKGALISEPIISNSSEVDSLVLPNFDNTGENPFSDCINRIDKFIDLTEGRIGLILPDPQGPMSLACQLWNQEDFFIALMTDADAVHKMMRFCTEAVAGFFEYLFARFGRNCFFTSHAQPYLYRPSGDGIALSEDMFGVLSPQQLNEFLMPYLKELSQRFGKIFMHSCGNCEKKMSIVDSSVIAALQFSQTDISKIDPQALSSVRLISYNDWQSRQQISDYLSTVKEKNMKSWIQVHTLAGEIDQTGNQGLEKWLQVCEFLKSVCKKN